MAFNHFYNTSAPSEKCTLYSDRNHINRRNVSIDVEKNFSACKQFFMMEIESRVLAATLDFMQITSLDDTPSEVILPPSLVDSTAPVQQKFLKDLACKIVDTYIINEENINALKEKLKKERSIDTGLLANGRFGCRFPGCTKSFTFDGKSRIAHEKTHGMHSHPSALPIPTSVASVKDDVRNYQLALLEYGMLFMNFTDAISEADGLRILRCWKFFLMFMKMDGAQSRKYALEGLHLLSQFYTILKHGMGGNIPLDLALEHYNRVLKEVIKKMRPNASNKTAISRFCKSISINKQLMDNFDLDCKVLKQSGLHIQKKCLGDLNKIVNELVVNNAFKCCAGRSYRHFKDCPPSLLSNFDLHGMFKWINEHKKNIFLNKTAR